MAFVALVSMVGCEVSAQAPRDSVRWSVVDSLPQGSFIRIWVQDTEYLGEFTGKTVHDIVLNRHGREYTVPTSLVSRLWVADGRASKDGFIFGAIIGGVGGTTLGLLFGGFMCESGCGAQRAQATVIGAVGGAGVMGIVGAAVGSLAINWKQRFP